MDQTTTVARTSRPAVQRAGMSSEACTSRSKSGSFKYRRGDRIAHSHLAERPVRSTVVPRPPSQELVQHRPGEHVEAGEANVAMPQNHQGLPGLEDADGSILQGEAHLDAVATRERGIMGATHLSALPGLSATIDPLRQAYLEHFSAPALRRDTVEQLRGTVIREEGSGPEAASVPLPTFDCGQIVGTGMGCGDAHEADLHGLTLVLRNLPARATCADLLDVIRMSGFQGAFLYLYLPMKANGRKNRGFAFVAFDSPSEALVFHNAIHGSSFSGRTSLKAITLEVAKQHNPINSMHSKYVCATRWGTFISG